MPAVDATRAYSLGDDLELIRKAATDAGALAMSYFNREPEVWYKPGQSPVSEADYAVDNYLRETLTAARPDYGWLSEETVDSADRLALRRTFIVDPIDGTRAFLAGKKTWCVSIAVVDEGVPVAGVLECPAMSDVFEAARGAGALLNGASIEVAAPASSPLVAGPKSLFEEAAVGWPRHYRRGPYYPSLAYRIAMVACGELDATFVKPNAHDWDIAAADIILREAGGQIIDLRGNNIRYGGAVTRHETLLAGSGELLAQLARALG